MSLVDPCECLVDAYQRFALHLHQAEADAAQLRHDARVKVVHRVGLNGVYAGAGVMDVVPKVGQQRRSALLEDAAAMLTSVSGGGRHFTLPSVRHGTYTPAIGATKWIRHPLRARLARAALDERATHRPGPVAPRGLWALDA